MVPHVNLRPTDEQYAAFASYLPDAHSWYKHLSLMTGRRFVVFVAPDAAIGRLVARLNHQDPRNATGYELVPGPEGPEFTEEHPRLHYGWKTTKEYRQRFGCLDYMCRDSADEPYNRDAGPSVSLPAGLEERCSFVLYPYVHEQFTEAVMWDIHSEAIEQLRKGIDHPGRETVLELRQLAEAQTAIWNGLDEHDRELLLALESGKPTQVTVSNDVVRYNALGEKVAAVYSVLREKEVAKIHHALAELESWLTEDR